MGVFMSDTVEKETYYVKVALCPDEVELVREIAAGIGCSRAAVVTYLLSDNLSRLAAIPQRSRVKNVRDTRTLLKGQDDWFQKTIRNARGPSDAFISTALEALLTLARTRYDTYR
jgi:hypothetical protein